MSRTKSATPGPENADTPVSLSIGDEDQRQTLSRALPILLPNEVRYPGILEPLRNSYKYVFVMDWLYRCRGHVRLASEGFDLDLFEIELLNLVSPVPLDDLALFVNKLKLALISKIQGKKVTSLNMFEPLFRMYFGSNTPLGGPEENDQGDEEDVETPENELADNYPRFDNLLIADKIEILYLLISEVALYNDFRDYVDKNRLAADFLRPVVLVSHSTQASTEDYVLLFDETALYRRVTLFPQLNIAKKRKLAPEYPEYFYKESQFDVVAVKFELVFKSIYQLDTLLKQLRRLKVKVDRQLYGELNGNEELVEALFTAELKKRRVLSSRRKEFEMLRLLATRKRSSRLEAKEKQKMEEEEKRRLLELEDLRFAADKRAERRRNLRESTVAASAIPTREQRSQMRQHLKELRTGTPEVHDILVEGVVPVAEDKKIVPLSSEADIGDTSTVEVAQDAEISVKIAPESEVRMQSIPEPPQEQPKIAHFAPTVQAAQNIPSQGLPSQNVPFQGFAAQSSPPQGFQPQGYQPQNFPPQGFQSQGFPVQTMPPQGYPGHVPHMFPGQPGFPCHISPPQGLSGQVNPSQSFSGKSLQVYPSQMAPSQNFSSQMNSFQGFPGQATPAQEQENRTFSSSNIKGDAEGRLDSKPN